MEKCSIEDIERLIKIRTLSDQADKKSFPEDIALYKQVLSLAPWDAISAMSIGSSYYNSGDFKNAIAWMEKAYEIDPDNIRIESNLKRIKYQRPLNS